MLLKYCILLGIYGSLASGQTSLPTFQWLNEFAPFSSVPLLKISFPDGNQDDFAILKAYNPIPVGANEREEDVDPCIFEGHLLNEPNVHVTLTGCPFTMNFEVQFSSVRLSQDMFKVIEGTVVPKGRLVGKLDVVEYEEQAVPSSGSRQTKALNPNGYITNFKAYYDDNFLNKFGDDAKNAVRRILAHTQHMWKWPTITTKLYFNVSSDIKYLKGDWATGVNFRAVCESEVPSFKATGINTNIFFGVRAKNPKTSTLGKAVLSGACQPSPYDYFHCAMMEYEESDIAFARSLAHELGHNHGINHDFIEDENDNKSPRFDSKNNPCTHVHGIMDYDHFGDGDKSLWTTCSVEDLTNFVNKFPQCLPEANPTKPPTEIGLPGLTINECDMREAVPIPQNGYRTVKYNGFNTITLCIDGYCAAFQGDKEQSACRRICGADSCKGAVIPKPCELNLPDGESWICNAKPYFKVNCVSKQCEVSYQTNPVQSYTDTCMRVCGQTSCDGVKLKTCS